MFSGDHAESGYIGGFAHTGFLFENLTNWFSVLAAFKHGFIHDCASSHERMPFSQCFSDHRFDRSHGTKSGAVICTAVRRSPTIPHCFRFAAVGLGKGTAQHSASIVLNDHHRSHWYRYGVLRLQGTDFLRYFDMVIGERPPGFHLTNLLPLSPRHH